VVARKGSWGFGADAIWMALGTTVRNTNVDFNQGAFAAYGLRRLGAAADLTLGMRVNTLQGNLEFKTLGVEVDQDQTWVDPLVGLILRTPGGNRLHAQVYTEIGGFGAGSDFTWQVFPTVGYKFTDRFSLEVGYRWLDLDYKAGEGNERFAYDVLTQGPVGGLAFRF
jgi:opacity protein-like surface antigen